MIQIAREAETDPHRIHEAPVTTSVRRLDQTLAARQPVLKWRPGTGVSAAFRLLVTEPLDGAANMALDEALLLSRLDGSAPPSLRFFGWDPATISLGYGQRLDGRVDVDAAAAMGLGARAPPHRRQRHPPRGAGARGHVQRHRRGRRLSRRRRSPRDVPMDRPCPRGRPPRLGAPVVMVVGAALRSSRACPPSASRAPAPTSSRWTGSRWSAAPSAARARAFSSTAR